MVVSRNLVILGILVMLGFNSKRPKFNVNDGLLIKNVTIISSNKEGDISQTIGHVLLEKDTILYHGKTQPQIIGDLQVIDGKGKYIIPGLIDSHVHLANMAGMTWQHKRRNLKLVGSYLKQLPKSFLYYGYTTLIDLNNYAPNVIRTINRQPIKPDIYTCGQQIQVMNDFMMIMEEVPLKYRLKYPFLFDKYNKNIKIPDSIDLNLHSPKAVVDGIVKKHQGVGVKIAYEDASSGFPQFWEQPSLNIMKDLKIETQKVGIPIVMHSPSLEGQSFGLDAEVDIFSHSMWNWYEAPEHFLDTLFTEKHQKVLKAISSKQIGYQLTYRTILGEVDLMEGHFFDNPSLVKVFPKDYLDWLKSEEGQWGKRKILNRAKIVKKVNPKLYNHLRSQFESDEAMFSKILEVMTFRINTVAKFLEDHNANLLFGTDNGAMNMATNPPGFNGFLEMQHWQEAGIPLEKIFMSATYNNAKAFNMLDRYGSIEKGKVANLLLLSENPLKSISAYDSIEMVIIKGEEITRNELAADFIDKKN